MINLYGSGITEILPPYFSEQPEVQALSWAIQQADIRRMDRLQKSMVWAKIDELPEAVLDAKAVELNAPYYDSTLPIATKRKIIKNTIPMYQHCGTRAAVEEMIGYVFGTGEVEEWFEYNGTPGTFKILTTASITPENTALFHKLIRRVKNVRSTLDGIIGGVRHDTQLYIGAIPCMAYIQVIK